jgi:hypothetical protein
MYTLKNKKYVDHRFVCSSWARNIEENGNFEASKQAIGASLLCGTRGAATPPHGGIAEAGWFLIGLIGMCLINQLISLIADRSVIF